MFYCEFQYLLFNHEYEQRFLFEFSLYFFKKSESNPVEYIYLYYGSILFTGTQLYLDTS